MKRILIAEDNNLVLETVARSLMKHGYEIIKSRDGEKCLEIFETQEIDLIITDLFMPSVNGYEMLSILRNEKKSNIPVLVLSAATEEQNVEHAIELGANDYMVKPFNSNELIERVKKLVG